MGTGEARPTAIVTRSNFLLNKKAASPPAAPLSDTPSPCPKGKSAGVMIFLFNRKKLPATFAQGNFLLNKKYFYFSEGQKKYRPTEKKETRETK